MNSTFLWARKWSQCDSASVGVAVQLFGPADLSKAPLWVQFELS